METSVLQGLHRLVPPNDVQQRKATTMNAWNGCNLTLRTQFEFPCGLTEEHTGTWSIIPVIPYQFPALQILWGEFFVMLQLPNSSSFPHNVIWVWTWKSLTLKINSLCSKSVRASAHTYVDICNYSGVFLTCLPSLITLCWGLGSQTR